MLGILLRTLVLEASGTVYLMSALVNIDLCHSLAKGVSIGSTSNNYKVFLKESFADV